MRDEPIHILSLGAGVQSSTLALMAAAGEVTPMPTAAIFADTQAEPKEVYDYLAYLTPLLPFPVHIVTSGNIESDFLRALADPSERCGQPPFFVWSEEKQALNVLWRKCTKEYKLDPIRRKTRELRGGRLVSQWIGISLDEAHRMKPSGVQYIENAYPLIDKRMKRHDCLRWMEKGGYKTPPKSACRFCPYINNARLRTMRDTHPEEWQKLVAFDHAMRTTQKATVNGARITGTLYVHRSCKPIDEVDLSTEMDQGQGDLFGNECEGLCGV
jgi:hypothetical protein